ncbi:SRPBCC family protein [Sphingomonas sp. Y38-1Y]|uniref:SRPBCC family protein n=1 Tax=Sphingomonas sp. Y38-1Y TaxID=3078265 RepID=UPI0028E39F39|nr:SRPBCC family protein [Sphingomonas sp. Y38-1Y]
MTIPTPWPHDREVVVVKVFDHPRERVFAAWMDPDALAMWYGPDGLAIETHEADLREGGQWRFDMVGTFDGKPQRFPNLMRFLEIVPNERIVMDYGTPSPDDPDRFRMAVSFDAQADGKTVLTLRQLHPSRERRDAVIGFGAVEYGQQTLESLARLLARGNPKAVASPI